MGPQLTLRDRRVGLAHSLSFWSQSQQYSPFLLLLAYVETQPSSLTSPVMKVVHTVSKYRWRPLLGSL
jgi:hypothetical protein